MTNWCQNRLVVTGAEDALGAWRAAQRGAHPGAGGQVAAQDLSFAAQVPVPPDVEARGDTGALRQVASRLASGPLDAAAWQALHWGSSRDAADVAVTAAPGALTVTFATAWAPPVPWLGRVASLWPALTFELWGIEPGNDLFVHAHWHAGQLVRLEERTPTAGELLAWGYEPDA